MAEWFKALDSDLHIPGCNLSPFHYLDLLVVPRSSQPPAILNSLGFICNICSVF